MHEASVAQNYSVRARRDIVHHRKGVGQIVFVAVAKGFSTPESRLTSGKN